MKDSNLLTNSTVTCETAPGRGAYKLELTSRKEKVPVGMQRKKGIKNEEGTEVLENEGRNYLGA
jgi:hypothetical protein